MFEFDIYSSCVWISSIPDFFEIYNIIFFLLRYIFFYLDLLI